MKRVAATLVLVGIGAALAGCGGAKTVTPTAQTVVGTIAKGPSVSGGDAGAGKTLFASNGCGGCHTYKPAGTNGKVGPDLDNLEADAKKANQGSVEDYTATSIKNPQAYVVPNYPGGVMPAFTSLSDKQLADLVAFLTQKS
jgi:mono/diheme cytochrome c family protein